MRKHIDIEDCKNIDYALVTSRFDYATVLLHGLYVKTTCTQFLCSVDNAFRTYRSHEPCATSTMLATLEGEYQL